MCNIEVAYAGKEAQRVIALVVPMGTTLEQAIILSGILEIFPEIQWPGAIIGVYGKIQPNDRIVNTGERIEIYRPLYQTPATARLQRMKARRATRILA